MGYFERICTSIDYYEVRHGRQPDVIFISTPLFCELSKDFHIECWRDEPFNRLCGIPVQIYTSLDEEYYLAEGAYWFE